MMGQNTCPTPGQTLSELAEAREDTRKPTCETLPSRNSCNDPSVESKQKHSVSGNKRNLHADRVPTEILGSSMSHHENERHPLQSALQAPLGLSSPGHACFCVFLIQGWTGDPIISFDPSRRMMRASNVPVSGAKVKVAVEALGIRPWFESSCRRRLRHV